MSELTLVGLFAGLALAVALYAVSLPQGGTSWWGLAALSVALVLAGRAAGPSWGGVICLDVAELAAVALVWTEGTGGRRPGRAPVSLGDRAGDRLHAGRASPRRPRSRSTRPARGQTGRVPLARWVRAQARLDPILLLAAGGGGRRPADDDRAHRVDRGHRDVRRALGAAAHGAVGLHRSCGNLDGHCAPVPAVAGHCSRWRSAS